MTKTLAVEMDPSPRCIPESDLNHTHTHTHTHVPLDLLIIYARKLKNYKLNLNFDKFPNHESKIT